jgi:hypothetical protein
MLDTLYAGLTRSGPEQLTVSGSGEDVAQLSWCRAGDDQAHAHPLVAGDRDEHPAR